MTTEKSRTHTQENLEKHLLSSKYKIVCKCITDVQNETIYIAEANYKHFLGYIKYTVDSMSECLTISLSSGINANKHYRAMMADYISKLNLKYKNGMFVLGENGNLSAVVIQSYADYPVSEELISTMEMLAVHMVNEDYENLSRCAHGLLPFETEQPAESIYNICNECDTEELETILDSLQDELYDIDTDVDDE